MNKANLYRGGQKFWSSEIEKWSHFLSLQLRSNILGLQGILPNRVATGTRKPEKPDPNNVLPNPTWAWNPKYKTRPDTQTFKPDPTRNPRKLNLLQPYYPRAIRYLLKTRPQPLRAASLEAIVMKNHRALKKWVWIQGRLEFEDHLLCIGSLDIKPSEDIIGYLEI